MLARAWAIYRSAAAVLLTVVLLLLLSDVLAGAFMTVFPRPTPDDALKARMLRLPYYYQQAWAAQYWTEHLQVIYRWQYSPYALWRTQPYQGQHINVDARGRRVTPNATCVDGAPRVFFFGGSTMWGYGVSDENTIPAYVQANLPTICAVNWGELGYNSTQNLILLQRLLASGDVPDVVVFYDGNNDIAAAHRYGKAGAHMFAEAFAPLGSRSPAPSVLDVLRTSNLARLLAPAQPQEDFSQLVSPPFDAAFVAAVADTYLANVRSLQALAQAYGFEAVAFVQPVLAMSARALSDDEQAFLWNVPHGFVELTREVYPHWQQAAAREERLVYLGSLFDDLDLPIWIDSHHMTAWGNLVVADAITRVLAPLVGQNE